MRLVYIVGYFLNKKKVSFNITLHCDEPRLNIITVLLLLFQINNQSINNYIE